MCFFKFIISTFPSVHYINYLICICTRLNVQEFGNFQFIENNNVLLSHSKFKNVCDFTYGVKIFKKPFERLNKLQESYIRCRFKRDRT